MTARPLGEKHLPSKGTENSSAREYREGTCRINQRYFEPLIDAYQAEGNRIPTWFVDSWTRLQLARVNLPADLRSGEGQHKSDKAEL